MSKGSWQRPGSGYASGYDRIFGKSANDSAVCEIVARGGFTGPEGNPVGWIFTTADKDRYPIAMECRLDGSVYIFGKLDESATAERRAVMLAASDEACNSALQAEPAGQHDSGAQVLEDSWIFDLSEEMRMAGYSYQFTPHEYCLRFARAIEAELARRSRTQGGHDAPEEPCAT